MPRPLSDDEFIGPSGLGPNFILPTPTFRAVRKLKKGVVIRGQSGDGHEIEFIGGPLDGQTILFAEKPKRMFMLADQPNGCAELQERKKAHGYLDRGDGVHYQYMGFKSITDLNIAADQDDGDGDVLEEVPA